MTAVPGIWAARIGGALAGIVAAGALLIATFPAQGGAAVGAELTAHADVTGELAVSPTGPSDFLHARALHPGQTASGSFTVTNQTGQRQSIRARAIASDPKLAHLLTLSLNRGGRLVLAPGESGSITATAALVPAGGSHWQAALIDYAVLLHTKDAP
jgi:hypothetical protein